jgi:lactoylglutathione lyase
MSNSRRIRMPQSVLFRAVGPIGKRDTDALPVKDIGPAVGDYTRFLCFSLVSKDWTTAKLNRDNAHIGLAVNGRELEQASCWLFHR